LREIAAAAPPSATEAPGFDLPGFLWRSILLGVLIGLFAGPLAIVVSGMIEGFVRAAGLDQPSPIPSWAIDPFVAPVALNIWIVLAWALILAPVGESLIFVAVHWVLKRLPFGRTLFVAVMGVFAYIAHGGVLANVAQAAGFMLLAAWYAHLARRYPSPSLLSPAKIPYYGIVLAHVSWNATAVLGFAIMAQLSRGMGPV